MKGGVYVHKGAFWFALAWKGDWLALGGRIESQPSPGATVRVKPCVDKRRTRPGLVRIGGGGIAWSCRGKGAKGPKRPTGPFEFGDASKGNWPKRRRRSVSPRRRFGDEPWPAAEASRNGAGSAASFGRRISTDLSFLDAFLDAFLYAFLDGEDPTARTQRRTRSPFPSRLFNL